MVFGEHGRAFVSRWNGGGVPSDLVNAGVLRRFWAAPNGHALGSSLLQSAWLAEQSTARPAERVPRPFEATGQVFRSTFVDPLECVKDRR